VNYYGAVGILIFIVDDYNCFFRVCFTLGQMSFWAANCDNEFGLCNPFIGCRNSGLIMGRVFVDHATLNRFFSLHYLFPFILLFLVILHVLVLHERGSTNPLGLYLKTDKIYFHPYYT